MCLPVYVCGGVRACVFVHVYVCMCVCVCVCARTRMHVHYHCDVCLRLSTHIYMQFDPSVPTCCCRRTGVMRSAGPKRHESTQARHNPIKHKRKPPKGMYLHNDDLMDMVTGQPGKPLAILKALDSHIVTLKRQVGAVTSSLSNDR